VCSVFTREDNTQGVEPIVRYPIFDGYIHLGDKSPVLNFSTKIRKRTTTMMLPLNAINGFSMRDLLQSQGMMFESGRKAQDRVGNFFMSWTQKLQESKETVKTASFGWVEDRESGKPKGFVFGSRMWTPKGDHQAPARDPVLARAYQPSGEVQPWVDAAKMITDQRRPGLEALVAASFASPLVRFTGEKGVLLSVFSSETGANKSTGQQVAAAVWGDHVLTRSMLDDTGLSVANSIGQIQSLPMLWDEIKTKDQAETFTKLTFTMTSGRDKKRMFKDITQREPGKWNTLLIACSNESIMDHVINQTNTTTAGFYRVFEYEIEKARDNDPGRINGSDASLMTAKLEYNYGWVGLEYAKFLGGNIGQIEQDLSDAGKELIKELQFTADERYWRILFASILVGMRYANALRIDGKPVIQFHEDEVMDYLAGKLAVMRSNKVFQTVDMAVQFNAASVLGSFLGQARARNTIVTDYIHVTQGRVPYGTYKRLNPETDQHYDRTWVHIGKHSNLIRIDCAAFKNFLHRQGFSRTNVINALNKKLNAATKKLMLGAGTSKPAPIAYCYEIDATVSQELMDYIAAL